MNNYDYLQEIALTRNFNRSVLKGLNYVVVKLPNLMGVEFQDQRKLDQDLEECLSPRGSQSVHGFFTEEKKQEYIRMEDLAPEVEMIGNEAPEEEASKMVVIKWPDKVEGSGDNIDSPLCSGLYKEDEDSVVPWSGTDPDAKMNCFSWSKENDDWIVPEDQYNE